MKKYAAILAGGAGTRFWPASRSYKPKQFLDITGTGKTLLQSTVHRLIGIANSEDIMVITNEKFRRLIEGQIPEILPNRILNEPDMRNTAPAIAYAVYKLYKEDPDAVLAIVPSDHIIKDESQYKLSMELAFSLAVESDSIVVLGIEPNHPNTGYGYIQYKRENDKGSCEVLRFVEKPDLQTARNYLDQGDYLWNAGMFISSVKYLKECFEKFAPEISDFFTNGYEYLNTEQEEEYLQMNYHENPIISIDYAIMEKADNVLVIPVDIGWSDLGSWQTMYEQNIKDENQNVIAVEQSLLYNTFGTIVKSNNPNKLFIIDGLKDFVVIDIDDIIYIAPRSHLDQIKELRSHVISKKGKKWS